MEAARRVREARRSGDLEGARRLSIELVAMLPSDAELQYGAACAHAHVAAYREAIRFYARDIERIRA